MPTEPGLQLLPTLGIAEVGKIDFRQTGQPKMNKDKKIDDMHTAKLITSSPI